MLDTYLRHIVVQKALMKQQDPSIPLGLTQLWDRPNRNLTRVFVATGGAHTGELLPPVPFGTSMMNFTRIAELYVYLRDHDLDVMILSLTLAFFISKNMIKEWLGMYVSP